MAYNLAIPTILDPNDPLLGSSYAAGEERARRVSAKKKKAALGDAAPDSTILPGDQDALRLVGNAPGDISQGDVDSSKAMLRNSELAALGLPPDASEEERNIALQNYRKQRGNSVLSSVLGG